ncbi:MAG: Ig-like domain-containing protein, partial [Lachnospiraceae bacterium]|nr:Ig-like domain-containing protein [Lachnospiraceae bacterium]
MVAFLSCNKSDKKNNDPVNPSDEVVVISPATASVQEGKTVQLNAITNPEGLALVWSSDDPTKATVDQTGVVTGVAQGEALITAKTAKGTEASCQVSVTSAMSGGGKNIDDYVDLYDEVYGLILHEAAQAKVGETVKGMFNVDDQSIYLDWWTLAGCSMPSAEGANFFGQASGEGSYLRFATQADYAG